MSVHKKKLRKPLGEDELIIRIKSAMPSTINVKVINIVTKKVLAQHTLIANGTKTLKLALPVQDAILGVVLSSINGNDFSSQIYLRSEKVYSSMTGEKPLLIEKFFKGGGGLAQQPTTATAADGFIKQADNDDLIVQTDGSYIIYH